MNTKNHSKFAGRLTSGLLATFLGLALLGGHASAQTAISIPNGDFSTGSGTVSPPLPLGLGNYTDQAIGTATPWRATGVGILNLIGAPTVNISAGDLTFSGLGVGLTQAIHNSAVAFNNNIGTNFVTGLTYTLTAEFTTNSLVDISLLSAAGFGISLRSAGADVVNSITNPGFASVSLLGSNSGSISLTYTHTGASGSNIGVSMFVGQGTGLASLGGLSQVSFDNLTLTAVPEPATWAAWGGAFSLLAAFLVRRRARAKNS